MTVLAAEDRAVVAAWVARARGVRLDVLTERRQRASSAAVADTALTADATARTRGSGTAVLSETVGERQGWHLPSAEQDDGQLAWDVAA